jgi:hypothetical protein
VEPSLLTRLRWRLEELRHVDDAKIIGGLLLIVALTLGGFLAARTIARTSAGSRSATRVVTVRQKVRVREHGHVETHWRVRRLYAQAQTVMRTQQIRTPKGVRLVTRRLVVYRNRPTRTVTRQVTDSRVVTVTQQVTVVKTTTAVSTQTITLPITITVTVP